MSFLVEAATSSINEWNWWQLLDQSRTSFVIHRITWLCVQPILSGFRVATSAWRWTREREIEKSKGGSGFWNFCFWFAGFNKKTRGRGGQLSLSRSLVPFLKARTKHLSDWCAWKTPSTGLIYQPVPTEVFQNLSLWYFFSFSLSLCFFFCRFFFSKGKVYKCDQKCYHQSYRLFWVSDFVFRYCL